MLLRNGPEIPMDNISLSMRTNLENGRLWNIRYIEGCPFVIGVT